MTISTPISLVDTVHDQLFIGGHWAPGSGGATFGVFDPATGHLLRSVADATVTDGLRALDSAVDAAEEWASTPLRTRGEVLRCVFELVRERHEEISWLISQEMGKPLTDARSEVGYAAEFLRWFAEEAVRISGRQGPIPEGARTLQVTHRPLGPCYLITPWNFPLAMATRKVAPAFAAGCTAVLKPSELTPLTALYLVQLFEEAGLPGGVLNVITTTAAGPVSSAIMADQRLRKISFTGSTTVGRTLMRQASDNVLRTSMELGGNAPFLVFDDADLDAAVEGAVAAKFRNSGQACTAANRFLVQRRIAPEFTRRIVQRVNQLAVGPGTEPNVEIGPLIQDRAVDKVEELVRDALDQGAVLATGGRRPGGIGSFYAPTVLTSVPPSSRIFREEVFGPVLSIAEFENEEEAITLANDTEYGLVSYAYTEGMRRCDRLIAHLDTGMTGINVGVISNASAPFGGVKHSGLGREGGVEGIHEYLSLKYTLRPDP